MFKDVFRDGGTTWAQLPLLVCSSQYEWNSLAVRSQMEQIQTRGQSCFLGEIHRLRKEKEKQIIRVWMVLAS